MRSFSARSKWIAVAGIVAVIGASGAGAATIHRLAISQASGSGGAQTFLQSSPSGGALQGEVAASARTNISIPFGVLGEYDPSGSVFGAGVLGISGTGYAVAAETLSTKQPSLLGYNTSGGPAAEMDAKNGGNALNVNLKGSAAGGSDGIVVKASGGSGIYTYSDSDNGIESFASANYIAATYSMSSAPTGGFGSSGVTSSTGGFGIAGSSGNANGGTGVFADAEGAVARLPALEAYTETPGTELFDAQVNDANTGSPSVSTVLTSASRNNSGGVFTQGLASSDLQINGDIYLTGAVYTNCGDSVPYATAACGEKTYARQRSSGGTTYEMYSAEHATKTVEDEGEATLREGRAHVSLDPSFASVISTSQNYLVFTTPLGDTRGLYVSNRTPQGFDVHETSGGRGSLAFDYRIVAHPFGEPVSRMAAVRPKPRSSAFGGRPRASSALLAHDTAIAKMRAARLHSTFKPHAPTFPASLVAPSSFTTK